MNNQRTIIELEAQISALKKQLKNIAQESKKKEEKLTSEINILKEENNNLMNLLKLSKKKMFGASAEKVAQAYGQISLFNEAEQERTVLTPEPKIEEVVIPEHTRKKKRSYDLEDFIGEAPSVQELKKTVRKVAPQDSNIMIYGETGTGKEIFAQSIHRASSRRSKKFLAINCAAIPETLIESLLFGTQKGSFTGSEDKAGYFEEASGGTLFLDELNSMSLAMQSKILRVIQENTFRRVGGNKDLKLDVRIISSCNEDPFRAIADNQFRRDLFYRLSTVMLELPPLREHLEDLEELVRYHLNATSYQYVHGITEVDPQVYAILRSYHWPGNVRELFHVLDYAQNVADSSTMRPEHLPSYLLKSRTHPPTPRRPSTSPPPPCRACWTTTSTRSSSRPWTTAAETSPAPPRPWASCGRAYSTGSENTGSSCEDEQSGR